MNRFLPLLAASAAVLAAAPVSAQETVSGTYDFTTGDIELTIGDNIGVVALYSDGSNLLPDNFSSTTLSPSAANPDSLQFLNATGFQSGTFGIGPVVRPGTASGDLFLEYDIIGGGGLTLSGPLTTVNVPEPASVALLGLGGVTLLGRRRSA